MSPKCKEYQAILREREVDDGATCWCSNVSNREKSFENVETCNSFHRCQVLEGILSSKRQVIQRQFCGGGGVLQRRGIPSRAYMLLQSTFSIQFQIQRNWILSTLRTESLRFSLDYEERPGPVRWRYLLLGVFQGGASCGTSRSSGRLACCRDGSSSSSRKNPTGFAARVRCV